VRISVIGCGYLGAVHAASMARLGHDVVGVDLDRARVASLSAGIAPFFEPGLSELLSEGIAAGRLRFTSDYAQTGDAAVHFVAVGTPPSDRSDAADLGFVDAAVDALIPRLSPLSLVVGKSTVPIGTSARLAAVVGDRGTLAWNPEFLREGHAIEDSVAPDRLVYGVPEGEAGERATALLDEVYAVPLANGTPRIVTDFATAELVKVAANAFLATKISFINAMAEVADATGADVTQLADALGHDARIGRSFLNAGLGFGGGCLPKDVRAFIASAEDLGVGDSLSFLREVDAINLAARRRMVDLTRAAVGPLRGKRLAVLGLAFKPNSDDVRDSPALEVAAALAADGAIVRATDPQAIATSRARHPELDYVASVAEAVAGADAVLVLTEWDEYRSLDPVELNAAAGRVVLDGRNCLDPGVWRAAGWGYFALGRH
jgi:UDPglucose 6-dehydrogenase